MLEFSFLYIKTRLGGLAQYSLDRGKGAQKTSPQMFSSYQYLHLLTLFYVNSYVDRVNKFQNKIV